MKEYEKIYAPILANNLKRLLNERGMSQNELGRQVGVSSATVSAWMRAEKYPHNNTLDKLCRFFNCSRTDLTETQEEAFRFHVHQEALGIAAALEKQPERMVGVKALLKVPEEDLGKVLAMIAIFAKEET